MSGHRREGFVLATATGIVGITFGVLADAAGLTPPQVIVMSALVFTGASQLAAVSVVASGGSEGAAVGSALLLAARNALYGPVVARLLPASWLPKAASAQFVIDETTAMATIQDNDADAADAFWWTAIWLWTLWNAGSILGVWLGAVIGEPEVWGLDAAFPAAFVALLAPHLRHQPGRVAAFGGAALAVVATPIAPAGVPLLVAVFAVVPGWVVSTRGATEAAA